LVVDVRTETPNHLSEVSTLGPTNWQPRTSLGWEIDHVLGYFAVTLLVLLAWPRPIIVGGVLVVFAVVLETLQGLTPDRVPNLQAAFYGAGGVLAAALLAELFIRARRWRLINTPDRIDRWLVV
jgi:hypothetical protein